MCLHVCVLACHIVWRDLWGMYASRLELSFGGCIDLFVCYHSAVVSSRLDLSFGGCIKLFVCYRSVVASSYLYRKVEQS